MPWTEEVLSTQPPFEYEFEYAWIKLTTYSDCPGCGKKQNLLIREGKKKGFWARRQITFCRDLLCYLEMGASVGLLLPCLMPLGETSLWCWAQGLWLFLLFPRWRLLDAVPGDCTCKGLLRKGDIPFKHVITSTFTSHWWDCGLSKLRKPWVNTVTPVAGFGIRLHIPELHSLSSHWNKSGLTVCMYIMNLSAFVSVMIY